MHSRKPPAARGKKIIEPRIEIGITKIVPGLSLMYLYVVMEKKLFWVDHASVPA